MGFLCLFVIIFFAFDAFLLFFLIFVITEHYISAMTSLGMLAEAVGPALDPYLADFLGMYFDRLVCHLHAYRD